jgi:NitT/TauT family transport system permease protein
MASHRIAIALVVAGFVGLLELIARMGWVSPITLVAPTRMASTLWELLLSGAIWPSVRRTFGLVVGAIALSVTLGTAFGVALHGLPRARAALAPFFASYYALPIFVFYPILVVILGLNAWPIVIIGAMFGTIVVLLATLTALDRVPPVMLKTAQVLRLSPAATFWRVRLPAMAPHLMSGFKLAVAYGFVGVIGAEFILAPTGLGHAIAFAYNNFDTGRMYALMLLIVLVAVAVNMTLHAIEQRLRARSR